MRRWQGVWRKEAIWLLLAAAAGYLIGNWNAATPPSGAVRAEGAPADALRFAADFAPPIAQTSAPRLAAAPRMAFASAQIGLFEPQSPLPGATFPQPAPQLQAAPPAATQTAELPPTGQDATPAARRPSAVIGAVKPRAAAPRQPHRLFDASSLARIKQRLHLTAAQEPLWPAVALALRNIGREQERYPQWRGRGRIAPDSAAVQELRSAAIPLLMSFSDAQKDEVRRLARNMGLDQLASEF